MEDLTRLPKPPMAYTNGICRILSLRVQVLRKKESDHSHLYESERPVHVLYTASFDPEAMFCDLLAPLFAAVGVWLRLYIGSHKVGPIDILSAPN